MTFGDVAGHFGKADELSRIIQDAIDHHRSHERSAVLADARALGFIAAGFSRLRQRLLWDLSGLVFGGVKAAEMLSDDLVRTIAFDPFGASIPGRYETMRVELENGVIDNCLDQPAVSPLAFKEAELRLLALGDVARDFRKADELPSLVLDGIDHNQCPEAGPVLADPPTPAVEAPGLACGFEGLLGKPCSAILAGVEVREED